MKRVVVGVGVLAVAVALMLWHPCGGRTKESTPATGSTPHGGRAGHPDPRTQPRASIGGTIHDERGPIANARVCAIATSRIIAPSLIRDPRCATSDARGHYAIAVSWPRDTT